ncbi:RNA-binding domain-containing protein [Metschnikowia bicuspidata]|uniref:RNA-binding domain-containing protein n=1 Tax=Metschnikowia bicuspidata TaxID=27322 RepID=A0A4P9ZAD8_9ASCO|nr:RNA-binding domain-containing protein [Metschnikowia bicuspidata]
MYHLVYAQILAENQIWMGDLDPRWSEDDIGAIWAELGERPANVKIVRDKAARAQYCFLTFANNTATAAALQRNRTRVPGSSHTFKLKKTSGMGGSADSGRPTPSHAASARNHAEYSLFVGDLAAEVSEDMLYARFNQQYPGAVKQVRITSDANTGDSKGFGFVRFAHPDALNASLREMNGVVIGNRAIRVGLANGLEQASRPKKAAETGAGAWVAQPQPPLAPSSDPNNSVLALKGITPNVTEDDLVAHFGAFGTLVYCKVDHAQHVAHVKYLLRTSAEKALVFMSGFVINGCSVSLRWGREQKPEKSGKYVAAPEPPAFYGDFAPYTVLDRMTETQLAEATISDAQEPCSVDEFNRVHEQALAGRAAYLELAL